MVANSCTEHANTAHANSSFFISVITTGSRVIEMCSEFNESSATAKEGGGEIYVNTDFRFANVQMVILLCNCYNCIGCLLTLRSISKNEALSLDLYFDDIGMDRLC